MRKMPVLCVLFAVVASACGSVPGGGQQGKTLATVNGEPLTEAMVMKEVENLPPNMLPMLETPEGKADFFDSIIKRNLLMREALRRGIDRRPEVADRIVRARQVILLEALLRDVLDKAPGLSDAALRSVYDANPALHQVGERVRVSHMLFREKARALEILARVKAGESFEALMKEVGSGNGEIAANLGEIERGAFVKEFEEAVFAATPGVVTGPVKTTYGYHLIKVSAKLPAGSRSFEEMKPKLLEEQREQVQREAFEKLVSDLRSQATVQIYTKAQGASVSEEAPASGAPKVGTPVQPPQGK